MFNFKSKNVQNMPTDYTNKRSLRTNKNDTKKMKKEPIYTMESYLKM